MVADGRMRRHGGWTVDELEATLHASSGTGGDHDVEDVIRFLRGVVKVVRTREAVDSQNQDPRQISVFLLAPQNMKDAGLTRDPMLDSGASAIAGKVWFVNAPVVSGAARPLTAADPETAFRTVTEELGLGSAPAVVVDPRQGQTAVRYYPKGLGDPDACEHVRVHCADLSLEHVSSLIERVYRQCLITPDAQPSGNPLWKDASKHRPHATAEHRVQAYLKPAFVGAFPTCRVYDEFAGTMGRADLHLEEQDPLDRSKVTFLAVIELKVLRSYSDGGTSYGAAESKAWIESGVRQAGMYRKERGHRVAALCCFDMRSSDGGDGCFSDVKELANTLQVGIRRWYLYGSSAACREAESTSSGDA